MSNDNKPNISVTGGPGKPHNSDDTSSTSSTGDTGGMGYTGGSGSSGLGGEVGKAISSIMDMGENVETFAKKVAYAGLYGATGGQGQPGSLEDAIKDSNSLSDLGKKFSEQVDRMNDLEAILKDFNECQTTLDLVLNKTNAVNAYFAFMQGKRLLKMQGIRTQKNSRDWIKWISGKLPNLKKRSREKYMSLASVPGVENYLEYGVERLAEFGIIYNGKSDEEKAQMGDKPFKTFLENCNIADESSYEERREHIDAAIEVNKLKRIKVIFPHDVMVAFLRVQDPLTGEERNHLKELYQIDPQKPVELLNLIIAKKLKRKNLIAGTDTPPSSPSEAEADNTQPPPAATGPNTPVTGPNIDKLVVTLCKSLEPVATMGTKVDGTYNRKALIQLKSYIDMLLLDTPQENQDAN